MKYKIGDKVRVRSDLVVGERYGNWCFNRHMGKYKGIKTEVMRVNYESYNLKLPTNLHWEFTDEMLEPIKTKGDDNVSVWQKVLDIVNQVHGTNIEMGEEFEILKGSWNPHKFTENGIKDADDYTPEILTHYLLSGKRKIKQLPWKPEAGERYYMPNIIGGEPKHFVTHWTDDNFSHKRFDANMVCKTEEEAIEKAKKMLEAIK